MWHFWLQYDVPLAFQQSIIIALIWLPLIPIINPGKEGGGYNKCLIYIGMQSYGCTCMYTFSHESLSAICSSPNLNAVWEHDY